MLKLTKTKRLKLVTEHVIKMVKRNFNVTEDFNDEEGHGYFTFQIEDTYKFDLQRNTFEVISYHLKNQEGYSQAKKLEEELQVFISNEVFIINAYLNSIYNL